MFRLHWSHLFVPHWVFSCYGHSPLFCLSTIRLFVSHLIYFNQKVVHTKKQQNILEVRVILYNTKNTHIHTHNRNTRIIATSHRKYNIWLSIWFPVSYVLMKRIFSNDFFHPSIEAREPRSKKYKTKIVLFIYNYYM